ncbi:YobI family P-loop NTPase [Exiguobacterium sp. 9-2]|uniref:YobI family P-loop NTPase n=1 Tax=Exiguobacterium sp. 9-2 TaxID=3112419 RepID=UPI002E3238B3|nr:hypothetical protein [Exiguobacterium sp. 9-2]
MKQKILKGNNKIEFLFEDLTPSTDIDEDEKYSNAISWGLENDNVKNIALTGPYGSGKSSLISTFESRNNKLYKFLNISIATFQENKDIENENDLEKSILQQMIYQVKDQTIPFSRFSRIKYIKNKDIIFFILLLIGFLYAGIELFYPIYFKETLFKTPFVQNISSGDNFKIILSIFLFLVVLFAPILIFKKMYKFFHGTFKFSKLTIASTTIEKGNNNDPQSIFDKYLDEIFYFFEATKYDVVVFEDLDRFNNLEIFERLRELNSLLNNSKQIDRKIVFIYALKDEIFGVNQLNQTNDSIDWSKNRTKFFDFIIPVIPIINSSNSIEKLIMKIDRLDYNQKIDKRFLGDVTIFIDDMRILKNIFNEFIIYKEKLGVIDLDLNNLMAIIIYKNIYPFDFSELQYGKGLVHDVLKNKKNVIDHNTNIFEKKIKMLKEELERVRKENLNSIEELQTVYLEALGMYNPVIYNRNSSRITIDSIEFKNDFSIDKNSFFNTLENAKKVGYYLDKNNRHKNESFEGKNEIETVFGEKPNYFDRKKSIEIIEKNNSNKLKLEIDELHQLKLDITSKSLKELIEISDHSLVFPEEIRDKKLLVYLLRNGYIDEMYNHYITYFYPGSLTEEDLKFVFSIKNHESLDMDYKLANVKKVIERLHGNEFKQKEILNFQLVDYLIENLNTENYKIYFLNIIELLSNKVDDPLVFIDAYRQNGKNKGIFFKIICSKWNGFWSFIKNNSSISNEEKNHYTSNIFEFADIEDINDMNSDGQLTDFVSDHQNFIEISPADINKSLKILLSLNIKFYSLEAIKNNEVLMDFVVKNNLYKINLANLKLILKITNCSFSYSNIKKKASENILNYLDENIVLLLNETVLKTSTAEEDENTLLELLNHEEVPMDLKKALIPIQNLLITDITTVDSDNWHLLLGLKKIEPSWLNVINYFNYKNDLDELLIDYLEQNYVAKKLSGTYIEDFSDFNEVVLDEFLNKIIHSKELNDRVIGILSPSFNSPSKIKLKDLNTKRIRTLINHKLLNLDMNNYLFIKDSFPKLLPLFFKKNIKKFFNEINNYDLNLDDINLVVQSNEFSKKDKVKFINSFSFETFFEIDSSMAFKISELIQRSGVNISIDLLNLLLTKDINNEHKVILITKYIKISNYNEITSMIEKLDPPSSKIAVSGKRPLIENNKVNRNFVKELEKINYISSSKEFRENIRIMTKKSKK